jgi:hypothetical protein
MFEKICMNPIDLIEIQNKKAYEEAKTLRGSVINAFLTLFLIGYS